MTEERSNPAASFPQIRPFHSERNFVGSAKLFDVYRKSLVTENLNWPDISRVRAVSLQISDSKDFVGCLAHLCKELGFSYFSYALGYINGQRDDNFYETRIFSNFPRDWIAQYQSGKYGKLDPVDQFSKRAWNPFVWGQQQDLACLTRDSRAMMEESFKSGLRMGLSLPVHGPCGEYLVLTMLTSGTEPIMTSLIRQNYNLLQMVAPTVHSVAIRHYLPDSLSYDIVLTEGERECLSWTARGKTSWEIAQISSRSKATVEYHMQKAMRKLNAVTKAQATALALKYNLL